jgi:AcrR family transcriptional regulator
MAAGRPRSFDTDKALDRAMHVFWRKGYEGTSLADLTRAMRINAPSLYAAFGNKEALFAKVLDRYSAGPANYLPKALNASTARKAVKQVLAGVIKLQIAEGHPGGCLVVQGAVAGGGRMRKAAISRLASVETAIRERLQAAKAEGDLPRNAKPAELASYVLTTMSGIAVAGATGASRKRLEKIAEVALRAWPS